MNGIETRLREIRPELNRFNVKEVWLFGSAVTSENARDVDILVEFRKPPGLLEFMGLKEYLEHELGRPVDVLSRNACSPRFLKRIEPNLVNVA